MNERPLSIEIDCSADRASRVRIHSTRPVLAARVFRQKAIDEVVAMMPRLFSVCGIAQGRAAKLALQRAVSSDGRLADSSDDALLMEMETAREHLWRVLMDWSTFVSPDKPDAVRARAMQALLPALKKALGDAERVDAVAGVIADLETLLDEAVFGMPAGDWLMLTGQSSLLDWAASGASDAAALIHRVAERDWATAGTVTPHFLPTLSNNDLDQRLAAADADEFVAAPDWQGDACETTPLSRRQGHPLVRDVAAHSGHGLLARLAALLVELAESPRALRAALGATEARSDNASDCSPGIGIAQVEAARGRLVHRATVDGDRVVDYQILAPTEWNFHPDGGLARGLAALDDTNRESLIAKASLLVTATDPCVGYSLEVH